MKPKVPPEPTGAPDRAPTKKKESVDEPDQRHAKATSGDTVSSATRPAIPSGPRHYASPKLSSAKTLVHYGLHFVFPVVLALVFFPMVWQAAYLMMLATMAIDLDPLLAKPIFDPLRCSIGYHPLHSFYAVPVYALLLLLPATQIIAMGLLFHLVTDTVDCLWNFSHCQECYANSRIRRWRNWVRKLFAQRRGSRRQPNGCFSRYGRSVTRWAYRCRGCTGSLSSFWYGSHWPVQALARGAGRVSRPDRGNARHRDATLLRLAQPAAHPRTAPNPLISIRSIETEPATTLVSTYFKDFFS